MSEVPVLQSVSDQLALVEKLRRNGAYDEALALCQDLVAETPRDPAPLMVAAAISRDAGRPDLGLPLLERAAALGPDRPDLLSDLGALLRDLGEDAGAEEAYGRAVVADPACRAARLALSEMFEAQDRLDAAAAQLDALVASEPGAFDHRERLAHLFDRCGDAERSANVRRETMRLAQDVVRESYERILRYASDTPVYEVDEARLSWSYALLTYAAAGTELARAAEREDPRKAVEHYRAMLKVLADAAEQAQEVDGLRRTYETAASAFAHCHSKLAALQETFGNPAGAVYHLEEAIRARRAPSNEDRVRLGENANRCAPDIAGIRDAVAAYHGRMPPPAAIPITRWDFLRHAPDWLATAAAARTAKLAGHGRRIAIAAFNPHHIQIFFAVACALFARGHSIDFLWLPCIAFDRVCDPEPVYDRWDEALLDREMTALSEMPAPEGFRLIDFRAIPRAAATPEMENAAARQANTDMRNYYRNESLDLEAEPMRTGLRNRRLKNLDAMRRAQSYLDAEPVDRIVLFNAGLIEYGGLFDAARARGVGVLEWEHSPPDTRFYMLSVNRRHGDIDMRQLWDRDQANAFDVARRDRVAEWLRDRGRGDWRGTTPRAGGPLSADARALLESLELDPDKPTAALFPNITWDSATIDRDLAFKSVADWAVQTAAFFAERPDWQLVVRSHPVEAAASDEFVGKILRDRWPEMPPNIRLVETPERLFSYRLLEAVRLGLYYTGTLGLEMAMLGIPAITGAQAPIAGYGFTREARTAAAYFKTIEQGFTDPAQIAMTQGEIDRAWRFADLYLVQSQQSLPWSYQTFWPSILEDWPMARVLGPEGARFDRVFAAFAGEIDLPDGIVGSLSDTGA